jgi:hypothetical protein
MLKSRGGGEGVEICSLRYPTQFTFIAHLKYPGLKAKKRGKKLVLNVWLGTHLNEEIFALKK